MDLLLTAFWFFAPAGMANMGPVFANKVPFYNRWESPLDFGKTYQGKRIFGANKRWRGLVAGIFLATLTIALQKYLFTHNLWALEHSWFDYRQAQPLLLGILFGTGALLGDAVESFFKRQYGVAPGDSWFPFDQTDYIIGALIFITPVITPSLGLVFAIFVMYFGLHLLASYLAFRIGLKDKPI